MLILRMGVGGWVGYRDQNCPLLGGSLTPEEHFPKLSPCCSPLGILQGIIGICLCFERRAGSRNAGGNGQAEPQKREGKQEG